MTRGALQCPTWVMMSGVMPAFPWSLGMPSASVIRVKVQMSCRSTKPCACQKRLRLLPSFSWA